MGGTTTESRNLVDILNSTEAAKLMAGVAGPLTPKVEGDPGGSGQVSPCFQRTQKALNAAGHQNLPEANGPEGIELEEDSALMDLEDYDDQDGKTDRSCLLSDKHSGHSKGSHTSSFMSRFGSNQQPIHVLDALR